MLIDIELLRHSPYVYIVLTGLLGLAIGSFLNVVIYRLPIQLKNEWQQECLSFLHLENTQTTPPINLMFPRSQCTHCQYTIPFKHNIPIISYLILKGQCANCHQPISVSYPIIESITAILSMLVAWHFGLSLQMLAGLLLTWVLIALSGIDFYHQLLPDKIVIPMIWLGLILSLSHIFADEKGSIIGAVIGYLSLFGVYHIFKGLTRKEGMGFGDFKLLSMLGAWLGYTDIFLIILLSSLIGASVGMTLMALGKQPRDMPMPFGPYLALAGWLCLLWGSELNQWYFG